MHCNIDIILFAEDKEEGRAGGGGGGGGGVVHMDCVRDTCISAVQYRGGGRGLSGPHVPGKSFSVRGGRAKRPSHGTESQ